MRNRVDIGLRLLIAANFIVVGVLALAMVGDWMRIEPPWVGQPSPPADASPTTPLFEMGLAHIPTSAECVLCHEAGGSAGMKPVPAIGHPVAGWTACQACHTNAELGRSAPGHEGIAQGECLNCHKEAKEGPPITQAHADLHQSCLQCHGDFAHLPTSMVGRNQDQCWLCHKPNPEPPPLRPHPDRPDLTCRTCHQASDVGGLPVDHALRADDTCVLCHRVHLAPSPSPPASSAPSS